MLLATLLSCTLALATLLAHEAYRASRSHRATAERALQDYAAVAAWEFVAGVNENLQTTLGPALGPLTRAPATTPYELLPSPAILAASASAVLRCPTAGDTARTYFLLDYRDGSLATTGSALTPAARAWLIDTVTGHGRSVFQPDWTYAVILGGPSGEPRSALAYAVKYAEHRAPIAAYGIRTCADAVGAPLVRDVIDRHALLPVSVTGPSNIDSIVALSVHDAGGRTIFSSADEAPSTYAAEAPLQQAGALTVRATIRRRAIPLLAFGALPESHVTLLVGLLMLTAAMIVATVMQLRRDQELSRLRADFISSVSHELRTPLSQILLFAETLNLGRVRSDEERRTAANVIVQEGRRLMHLVDNILHFSRAERHMTRLGPEVLDLNQAVRAIVDDWTPIAGNVDVHVDTAFAPDVQAVADPGALKQIVINLLDNAVKYGPPGQTVTVGTSSVDHRARLWVEDEGEGIPEGERERVWHPFYRLDRHANSAVAGSGIGLYVVRELARLHGGDARIEAAPRHGARIVVELPA